VREVGENNIFLNFLEEKVKCPFLYKMSIEL